MTLDPAWARALTALVNQALLLDDDAPNVLGEVAPCSVGVHIKGLDLRALVLVETTQVKVVSWEPDLVADVSISGLRASLFAMAREATQENPTSARGVEIHGDAALAQTLSKLFGRLDLDWEEALSRVIGDIPAHEVGNKLRAMAQWISQSAENFERDVGDYLVSETQAAADRTDAREMADEIDDLRDSVERLEQRVERLLSRRQSRHE